MSQNMPWISISAIFLYFIISYADNLDFIHISHPSFLFQRNDFTLSNRYIFIYLMSFANHAVCWPWKFVTVQTHQSSAAWPDDLPCVESLSELSASCYGSGNSIPWFLLPELNLLQSSTYLFCINRFRHTSYSV